MTEDFELTLFDRLNVIRDTINKYGEKNFYISFSGGKDSTVLSHIVDEALPDNQIPRVFINTGIEYKHIVDFVKQERERDKRIYIQVNHTNIRRTLEERGYPFKSKEHSQKVSIYQHDKSNLNKRNLQRYLNGDERRTEKSRFMCPDVLRYQFTTENTLRISHHCCDVLKKANAHEFERRFNKPIAMTGVRVSEGWQRAQHKGCTVFSQGKLKKFNAINPCSDEFVEWYIKTRNVQLCDLYYPPYTFERTGCKGCPFALNLQEELETMGRLLPNERKQCEWLWKPVYDEYRRLGYRLKKTEQAKLF